MAKHLNIQSILILLSTIKIIIIAHKKTKQLFQNSNKQRIYKTIPLLPSNLQATFTEENSHFYTNDLQSLQSFVPFLTIKFTPQSQLCNCKVRKVTNYLIIFILQKENFGTLQSQK